jgi:hypothetical protein
VNDYGIFSKGFFGINLIMQRQVDPLILRIEHAL